MIFGGWHLHLVDVQNPIVYGEEIPISLEVTDKNVLKMANLGQMPDIITCTYT